MNNATRESILSIMIIDIIELLVEKSYCPRGIEQYDCKSLLRPVDDEDCKECIVKHFENKAKKYLFGVK